MPMYMMLCTTFKKLNLLTWITLLGVENFEMALEHWYEAAEYVMTQRGQSHPQQGDSFFFFEADAKLNALISSSRKLRKVIEQYDLSVTSLPRTPSNMLTWIDDESLQEQLQMGMVRDLDLDDSSDADSFDDLC